MPRFTGALVSKDHNPTVFKTLYEFNVRPPADETYDPGAALPAYVTPELERSHIAEHLAVSYGGRVGDVIELVLLQYSDDETTVDEFRLPVLVQPARSRLPEYVQIGLDDLEAYFETRDIEGGLMLRLKDDADRECETRWLS